MASALIAKVDRDIVHSRPGGFKRLGLIVGIKVRDNLVA